jgi:chromosome segregation ATPase
VNSDRRGGEASRVDEALGRFENAMRQLEAALAQLHEQQAQRMRTAGDAAALRTDRLRLVQELAEVRAKASELGEQQRRASRRIEQAMARIRRVLGE